MSIFDNHANNLNNLLRKSKTYSSIDDYVLSKSNKYADLISQAAYEAKIDPNSWFGSHIVTPYIETKRNAGLTDYLTRAATLASPVGGPQALYASEILGLTPAASAAWKTTGEYRKDAEAAEIQLAQWANIQNRTQFRDYISDAVRLGYLNEINAKDAIKAFNKLVDNNFDYKSLKKAESKALLNTYNSLYKNDRNFKRLIGDKGLTDQQKLDYLTGAFSGGFGAPAPTYFSDIEPWQRNVEPLKHYTNDELAEIYGLDYNWNNIKERLDNAAEAKVKYSDWAAGLIANAVERDNNVTLANYLDSIRDIKSEALQTGVSNGARAAAEVLSNINTLNTKVAANHDAATNRFETMSDALLDRASTDINAMKTYDQLAQVLSNAGTNLYANDVGRRGADTEFNANVLSSDYLLKGARLGLNARMKAAYDSASAVASAYKNSAMQGLNYFKDVTLPAMNYDFNAALNNYIQMADAQNYGYLSPVVKLGEKQ